MAAEFLLEARGLKKWFPIRKGLWGRHLSWLKAVDDVNFQLRRGETLGLVGESGCGKSTIGRLIITLLLPTAGEILFDGENIFSLRGDQKKQLHRRVQIIFQDPYGSLNPRMTVGDILAEPMQIHKLAAGPEISKRNDSYWKSDPQVETIFYRPIVDDQARITELEAGRIDFMVGILPDDLVRLRENPRIKIQEQAGMHTWYLVMNCSRPPFNDVRVRQAVNYAVNKKAIVDYILQGTAKLARNLLPPVIWSYTDDVADYAYNPQKAKELLKQAGHEKGLRVEFYVPESGSGMQQPVTMATAIQSDLDSVGIKVDIKQLEWGTYLDKVFQPADKNEILLHEMSWIGDNGDPDNFLYILASGDQWPTAGYNESFYKNEAVDKLLRKARTTSDVGQRTALYQQAQKMIMADSPIVVVDHESQIVAMKKNIDNFILHPTGIFRFRNVTVTP